MFDSVGVFDKYNLIVVKIVVYYCDILIKVLLDNILILFGCEVVYKVFDCLYVVYGFLSVINIFGFCYVKVENVKKVGIVFYKCSCKGFVVKVK